VRTVIASGGLGRFDLPALWPSATILNGLGRLLISQGFLPKSDTNGHFQRARSPRLESSAWFI